MNALIRLTVLASLACGLALALQPQDEDQFDPSICLGLSLFSELRREIRSKRPKAQTIIDFVLNQQKGRTWKEVAELTDRFGPRMTGSSALEKTIDYMVDKLKKEGLQNVHTEPFVIDSWTRGDESCQMLTPRIKNIRLLGLAYHGNGTVTAPVIVVRNIQELERRKSEVAGKIVVFNPEYSEGVELEYPIQEAEKYGAVGLLIRPNQPFALDSVQLPPSSVGCRETPPIAIVHKILAASITIEDANLMQRMVDRGENVTLRLSLGGHIVPNFSSRNTFAEITGKDNQKQHVVIAAHLDSWDIGEGVVDDAGCATVTWRALSVLKALGLTPRRSLRAILWSGNEQGCVGARKYLEKYHDDLTETLSIYLEADEGAFKPFGLWYGTKMEPLAKCILYETVQLVDGINATQLKPGRSNAGFDLFQGEKFPVASLGSDNRKFNLFHHTEGDTINVYDPHDLDLCTALWAVVSYVLADLREIIPVNPFFG